MLVALLGGLLGAPPAGASELFVSNIGNSTITVYDRTASGNTPPLRTLGGAATGLNEPEALAVDLTHGELFVVNLGGPSISVFDRGAAGNAAPLRVLSGAATGLNQPNGLALDLAHDELFVANGLEKSITVHARTASGNAAPLRTLSGAATGLNEPASVVLDLVHDELFVVNELPPGSPSITVYSRTASSNTAPLRTLSLPPMEPVGLALDPVNDELFVSNQLGNSVAVYSRTASGAAAPLRTLMTGATTGRDPGGLAVDPADNELFVSAGCCLLSNNAITVYSRTASGTAAPLRILNGPATGLNANDLGIAVADATSPPPQCTATSLVSAVLPSSRSVQVSATATVFATVLDAGPSDACGATIRLASPIFSSFTSNQTDCATNAVIGADNAAVDIAAGSSACFVLSLTPTAAFLPTEVAFAVSASNAPAVATLVGINTLLFSASTSPVPDIVALAATLTNDGIVHVPGPAGAAPFAVASVNVGASALITVSTTTGGAPVPLSIFLCQTNAGGACMAAPATSVAVQINAGDQPTFGIFVNASGTIPLDPANSRVFVVFTDGAGTVRGRTSVAVETQ